jgi:hypothetical protein
MEHTMDELMALDASELIDLKEQKVQEGIDANWETPHDIGYAESQQYLDKITLAIKLRNL